MIYKGVTTPQPPTLTQEHPVEEGIKQLTTLCATELHVNGQPRCNRIPEPRESIQELLAAAEVRLPDALACKGIKVATRKKLPENRIKS